MDIQTTDQKQSISDDQELAKVLAGISDQEQPSAEPAQNDAPSVVAPSTPMPAAPTPTPADNTVVAPQNDAAIQQPDPAQFPAPEQPSVAPMPTVAGGGSLEAIKQQALGELRPLVDKLDVAPEEKFDTYLLLLRSTDDKDLIAPAHDAAAAIQDEARRAQALLDIIKEIDFLSQNN